MDKLNKLAMPDVKSGTPQEKLNAVKRALQSLEMMTEAYNQIVPVINAKIDWLHEAEKVAKDDTQDKKIDELIAVNKLLLGRIAKLESKDGYDDREILARISSLESKPDYKYDDKPITKMIADISKQQDALARSQNALDKALKAIEIPKVPSVEPLRKRIKALENAPKYVYNDTEIKERLGSLEVKPQYDDKPLSDRVAALESKPESPTIEKYDDRSLLDKMSDIEQSIESLDKRLDFVRRTYSEKWESIQYINHQEKTGVKDRLDEIELNIRNLVG